MPFAPGSDCFLKKPLRIQFQRNTARQCFSGKLSLHLGIEFDVNGHGILTTTSIIGWLLAKVDPSLIYRNGIPEKHPQISRIPTKRQCDLG
jgi:hypothetical protein